MKPSQVRLAFARHETFQPRFGWFKKAFDGAVSSNGAVFNDDAATVLLGVGKNMVRAIRFWGIASKVLDTARDPERPRTGLAVPSVFGQALLSSEGWDPYLEDVASIWLLHWTLLRPPCLLPVWWVAFNEFDALEFLDEDLVDATVRRAALVEEWAQPHVPSVKKDVDCLLRMYCHGDATKSVEDAIDCPFRLLRLVEPLKGVARSYRFMRGHKQTLPAEIIAFAALDYMAQAVSASTITLTALASVPGGPGRVFKISDDEIAVALEAVSARSKLISVESPAGARQLVIHDAPSKLASSVLRKYYRRHHDSVQSNTLKTPSLFADVPLTPLELVEA
ncbi:MAG: DUF4007 family protein [Acidimicrobiia bacterium]|nr:DUF4007 family protein [Acidimicrobiia bacterium]